jgi:hypothetical protein
MIKGPGIRQLVGKNPIPILISATPICSIANSFDYPHFTPPVFVDAFASHGIILPLPFQLQQGNDLAE